MIHQKQMNKILADFQMLLELDGKGQSDSDRWISHLPFKQVTQV